MFEKSSVHNGVDGGIAGVIQRASVASDPRSVALRAITIHSDDNGPGPAVIDWPALCCCRRTASPWLSASRASTGASARCRFEM